MVGTATEKNQFDEGRAIKLAQAGDGEAFDFIVRQYRLPLINVVYRMCGNVQLAEDAAQEGFLRCWQHLASYQLTGSFRAWLYRLALNAAYDFLRREKPQISIEDLGLSATNDVEKHVSLSQQKDMIQKAILQLPEASRIVLILREYDGLSYREISETLEIPIGTVMSRLNYARRSLMHILQPVEEVP